MRRTLAILLLLAGPALGQDPAPPKPPAPPEPPRPAAVAVISSPTETPYAGQSLVVYSTGSVGQVKWKLVKPAVPFASYDNGAVAIITKAEAGVYLFQLMAVQPPITIDGIDVTTKEIVVVPVPEDRRPDPPVPPVPVPPQPNPPEPPAPAPSPVGKGFIVTAVVDSGKPRETPTAVSESTTLEGSIKALGGRWSVLDARDANGEFRRRNLGPVLGRTDQWGPALAPPALVIQDATGAVLRKMPCPSTEAQVLDILSSLRGALR